MDLIGNSILVIAPHADDDILGCGGLIHSASNSGKEINIAVINMEEDHRLSEMLSALSLLKQKPNLEVFGYLPEGTDSIPVKRIASWIEDIINKYQPYTILIPDLGASHQDHRKSAEAAIISCRVSSGTDRFIPKNVLSYELVTDPWPTRSIIAPQIYFSLSDKDLDFKINAMKKHVSQYREYPSDRSSEIISSLAMLRGSQSGNNYAEAYNVLRIIIEKETK